MFGVSVELALIYDFAIQVVRNDHRRMSGQVSESVNGSSDGKCSSHGPPRDSGHGGHGRVSSAPHVPEIQGTGISKHDKGGGMHGGIRGGMLEECAVDCAMECAEEWN